jgi:hypothetical protein
MWRAHDQIEKMIAQGLLESKMCFAYCGDDKCNCIGGAFEKIYQEEVDKERNEPKRETD